MSNEHNYQPICIYLIFHSRIISVEDSPDCEYHFYVGSNGTSHNSFLNAGAERLVTAQREETEFNVKLNQIKACDLAWLVIGCDHNGSADKLSYVKFNESSSITCGSSEPNVTKCNITDGSSHLQSGLLTMVLTLSIFSYEMKHYFVKIDTNKNVLLPM